VHPLLQRQLRRLGLDGEAQADDAPRWSELQVDGMTPNPRAARLSVAGRLANGAPAVEEAAFFVRGLRVYQASMVGTKLAPEATDTFFAGLRLPV